MEPLDGWLRQIESGGALDRIWPEIYRHYGYEGVRVFDVHGGTAELTFAEGGEGEPLEELKIVARPWDGVIGRAFNSGELLEVRDYPRHPDALPTRSDFVRSLLVLPLRFGGEDHGAVVMTMHTRPHPGLDAGQLQELRILQSLLSAHAALRRQRRRNERQRGLVAFMDEIHKINRLDELVPVLFRSLSRDVAYNAVAINFIEGASLRILYGVGESGQGPRTIGEAIVPFEKETLTHLVFSSGEPLLIGDMTDPMARQMYPVRTLDPEPERDEPELRSFLAVPFESRSTKGVLSLQSMRPWHYGLEDLEHLVSVAEVLGYAIEHLRWRGLERFARRLGQLQWRAGEEREFFHQLLLATSEVWNQLGAAFFVRETQESPFERIAVTGRVEWLPRRLDPVSLHLEQPLMFSRFRQLPEVFQPLWNPEKMQGGLLLPFGEGFIWLASARGFTEWDLQLARSMMREIRPYAERLGLQARLAREAALDPLTGVYNRRQLDQQLARLASLAARHGHVFSLAVVDMANFGSVNNRYGHLVGDRVLARVAGLLKQALREEDEVYRLGGDEFVIVLPHAGREEGLHAARRAAEVIARDPELSHYGVHANFGLAVYREGDTPEDLLERADREMYAAKKRGLTVLEQPLDG
ncbi:sensor domain-containing diguanylate cyclase [Oceanithermus sp.]|uniref:sensor domain-containing diguanylate cyclase n=1 Tax=Oceanithermus sp. TaxID=2268145 RepID=UPI002580DE9B|nr:sensor domain-containing diguanylate cyclase [Oceanithermus sp.]